MHVLLQVFNKYQMHTVCLFAKSISVLLMNQILLNLSKNTELRQQNKNYDQLKGKLQCTTWFGGGALDKWYF